MKTMISSHSVLVALSLAVTTSAFVPSSTAVNSNVILHATSNESNRREMLHQTILPVLTTASVGFVSGFPSIALARTTGADNPSNQYAPEFVQKYEDFQPSAEGWQYKDVKVGTGDVKLEMGDRAVFDWSGYTIGYFGRPFEAKGYVGYSHLHCQRHERERVVSHFPFCTNYFLIPIHNIPTVVHRGELLIKIWIFHER